MKAPVFDWSKGTRAMINPGTRRALCRTEAATIRKRLYREYKPKLNSASTDEERRRIRLQRDAALEKAIEPFLDQIQIVGRCRVCDYILFGLDQARCPECGTEFDLSMLNELVDPPSEHRPSPQTLY